MFEKEAKEYAEGMAMYYKSAHGSILSQFEKYLRKAVEYGYNKAWERLDKDSHYYFANDCIFNEETDNLVAFSWYESAFAGPSKYYKVVKL